MALPESGATTRWDIPCLLAEGSCESSPMKREAHAVPAGSAMGVCHAAGVLNLSGQGVVPGMLSGLVGLPLLAMVGVWCCPAAWVRRVAVGGGIATLLWTGLVLAQFDVHTAGWQMGEQVP